MAKKYNSKLLDSPARSSFADYYRQDVEQQLRSGLPHSTLGQNLKKGSYETSGLDVFVKLEQYGLRSDMICVDYGCGTLRVGQHIIRTLDSEAYWGLDISEYLLEQGRNLLPPSLFEEKKPNLRLISPDNIAEIASRRPGLIFANAVLMHVHPKEMGRFAQDIVTLSGYWGKALFTVKCSEHTVHYSRRSWSHAYGTVQEAFAVLGTGINPLESEPSPVPGAEDSRRFWMELVR